MNEKKKYYWLRLKKDFFKRHDIRIIEDMPNGKDYILFYLKLLCESIDHEGNLRFSEEIPYNDKMLSAITNTNIDIVRTAIEVFTSLGMMDLLDDGTYYMSGVEKMIGCMESDEHTRESTRLRVRRYRAKKEKALIEQREDEKRNGNVTVTLPLRYSNVTCNGEIEKEIEKENISISKDILVQLPKEVERVIKEWNSLPEPIKRVRGLTQSTDRYKQLNARIKEYGIESVIEAIHKVGESDFLRRGSDKGWQIDFGWFVKPNNFPKVLEGKYDNKGSDTKEDKKNKPLSELTETEWMEYYEAGKVTTEDYYKYHG